MQEIKTVCNQLVLLLFNITICLALSFSQNCFILGKHPYPPQNGSLHQHSTDSCFCHDMRIEDFRRSHLFVCFSQKSICRQLLKCVPPLTSELLQRQCLKSTTISCKSYKPRHQLQTVISQETKYHCYEQFNNGQFLFCFVF